jgi:hypothetical protein
MGTRSTRTLLFVIVIAAIIGIVLAIVWSLATGDRDRPNGTQWAGLKSRLSQRLEAAFPDAGERRYVGMLLDDADRRFRDGLGTLPEGWEIGDPFYQKITLGIMFARAVEERRIDVAEKLDELLRNLPTPREDERGLLPLGMVRFADLPATAPSTNATTTAPPHR